MIAVLERNPRSPSGTPGVTPETRHLDMDGDGEELLCKACRRPITTTAARIEAFGAHLHDRMNLAGRVFCIGTFAAAPGAMNVTAPSDEFPWFPGHLWQITICRGCHEHLGWFFSGPSRFFGLLPEKLEPAQRGRDGDH